METSQLAKSKVLESFQGFPAGYMRQQIETHEGSGPAGERTPQHARSHSGKQQASEITNDFSGIVECRHNRCGVLRFGEKAHPFAPLKHDPIGEAIERNPVHFIDWNL
jgi:hypothetical protein